MCLIIRTTGPNLNNAEVQHYTTNQDNICLSGSGYLWIRPQRDSSGAWTSGRVEGKKSFTCPPGHAMIMQARLCAGYAPPSNQAGIWPAFWALGQDIREGTPWPGCGEWDIYEAAGGVPYTIATLHYSDTSNTNHFMLGGFGAAQTAVSFSSPGGRRAGAPAFHTFAIIVDRRPGTWQKETLTWTVDGRSFFKITGSQLNEQQWDSVAHKAFFPILNVAIGTMIPVGDQQPNQSTSTGLPVGMQVDYVGVYQSS